jgi:hypothetical protein
LILLHEAKYTRIGGLICRFSTLALELCADEGKIEPV